MSEIVRELWRAVRGTGEDQAPERPPAWSPVRVEATLPAWVIDRVGEELLYDRLTAMFADRARQVGLEGRVVVLVAPSQDSDLIEVICNDRPAAVFAVPPEVADLAHLVTTACDQALLNRLTVLLDDAQDSLVAQSIAALAGDRRPGLYRDVPSYLLSNGLGLRQLARMGDLPGLSLYQTSAEIAEDVIDRLAPTTMTVEVSETTLRSTSNAHARALVSLREAFLDSTGLEFPDLHLAPTRRPPGVVRFWFNDVGLPERELGPAADWSHVVQALGESLQQHPAWFVRLADVESARARSRAAAPDLVDLSTSAHSGALLSACVRSMVNNGNSVANFTRMLWLLLDSTPATRHRDQVRICEGLSVDLTDTADDGISHIERITSGIRHRMVGEAWPVGVLSYDPALVLLPTDLERAVLGCEDRPTLGAGELAVVRHLASIAPVRTVAVRNPDSLWPVQQAVRCLAQIPRVIAAEELPPDAAI